MSTDFEDNTDNYRNLEAYMDAVEGNGPQTTLFALLKESGIDMPAPDVLADSELTALLWKIIEALADMGVYLTSTNHLSDRDLYTVLWQDTLLEDHPVVSHEFPMTTHIDLLGGWSDEDQEIYLKYYADDEERAQIASQTNTAIPEHEDPPFRRDHLLPGA